MFHRPLIIIINNIFRAVSPSRTHETSRQGPSLELAAEGGNYMSSLSSSRLQPRVQGPGPSMRGFYRPGRELPHVGGTCDMETRRLCHFLLLFSQPPGFLVTSGAPSQCGTPGGRFHVCARRRGHHGGGCFHMREKRCHPPPWTSPSRAQRWGRPKAWGSPTMESSPAG